MLYLDFFCNVSDLYALQGYPCHDSGFVSAFVDGRQSRFPTNPGGKHRQKVQQSRGLTMKLCGGGTRGGKEKWQMLLSGGSWWSELSPHSAQKRGIMGDDSGSEREEGGRDEMKRWMRVTLRAHMAADMVDLKSFMWWRPHTESNKVGMGSLAKTIILRYIQRQSDYIRILFLSFRVPRGLYSSFK